MQESKLNRLSTTAGIGKMVDDFWQSIRTAPERGEKVAWVTGATYPFALAMGIRCHLTEAYCAYAGGRHAAPWFLERAEERGEHPETCSYHRVHTGVLHTDVDFKEVPEHIQRYVLPLPDLLLLHKGCVEHAYEILGVRQFMRDTMGKEVPMLSIDVTMAHDPEDIPHEVEFFKRQMREEIIPGLEEFCGKPYDYDRLSELVAELKETCTLRNECMELMKNIPAPATNFDMAVSMAPTIYLLGNPGNTEYFRRLKAEMEDRVANKVSGILPEEKYRIYFDGFMLWGWVGWFARKLVSYGANMIIGRYAPMEMFPVPEELDPERPVDSLIEQFACRMRTGLAEDAMELVPQWVQEYSIDGMIMHNSRTCRFWNQGQMDLIDEVEKRFGVPGMLLEADMLDPRFFFEAQADTRMTAFFEMIDARRRFSRR